MTTATIAFWIGVFPAVINPYRAGAQAVRQDRPTLDGARSTALAVIPEPPEAEASRAPRALRPLRIESRNLGHFLNTDLNACETDKVRDLLTVLKANTHTDVFLFQEISPDLRPTLSREIGGYYDITMAPECTDVAVLVRRGLGVRIAWADHREFQVEQEGFGRVGCSRYGVISAIYRAPLGAYTFVSAHLPSDALPGSSTLDGDVRTLRRRFLRRLEKLVAIERLAGRTVVVGGDFNIDPSQRGPDAAALRELAAAADLTDANRQPTVLGLWRFDHVLVFSPGPTLGVHRAPAAEAIDASFAQGIRWTDHRGVPLAFLPSPLLASALRGGGRGLEP